MHLSKDDDLVRVPVARIGAIVEAFNLICHFSLETFQVDCGTLPLLGVVSVVTMLADALKVVLERVSAIQVTFLVQDVKT